MTKRQRSLERQIVSIIQGAFDEVTMPRLALALAASEGPIALEIHGKQHNISQAIERLRRRDLIVDVKERCITCTRAKRKRNGAVALQLTAAGRRFNDTVSLPPMRSYREMTDILHGVA